MISDDEVILEIRFEQFRPVLRQVGIDTEQLGVDDIEALRALAREDPRVDFNLYRAIRCIADQLLEIVHPPVEEETLDEMKRAFIDDEYDE